MRTPSLTLAIELAGSVTALARLYGITHGAVSQWEAIPADRALETERLFPSKILASDVLRDLEAHRLAADRPPDSARDSGRETGPRAAAE